MSAPRHQAWSADEIRALGYSTVDLIADYLTGLAARPVFQPVPARQARSWATAPVPAVGSPVEAVLDEFASTVAPYPFGNGHPRFAAWVNPPPHVLGVFAEALAAAMNPSVAGGNHAAVHIEHQVVRWFAELAGFPPHSTGLLVSGGSAATLTALAVARYRSARRAGLDPRADGLQVPPERGSAERGRGGQDMPDPVRTPSAHGPFVLYLGEDGHGCARKAAEMLGIGAAHIRTVDSDRDHRLRPDALGDLIAQDVAAGAIPVAVVASVGTVNTGAIDDLDAIADVCADHGVWLHVDGAYGGPAALLLERYAGVRAALSRVDSLALDPHKWLYTPVDAGLVLVRDARSTRDAFSLVPPYLRTDGDLDGVTGPVWFSEYGFDQTRPFRALKVWMLVKHLGLAGYRDLIRHDLAMAARLAAGVRADANLQLLAEGLSVVCFRCRPEGWPDDDARLDELNRAVLSAVQLGGRAFLAGTTVDGRFALRACVVNPGMAESDVDAILAAVRDALTGFG